MTVVLAGASPAWAPAGLLGLALNVAARRAAPSGQLQEQGEERAGQPRAPLPLNRGALGQTRTTSRSSSVASLLPSGPERRPRGMTAGLRASIGLQPVPVAVPGQERPAPAVVVTMPRRSQPAPDWVSGLLRCLSPPSGTARRPSTDQRLWPRCPQRRAREPPPSRSPGPRPSGPAGERGEGQGAAPQPPSTPRRSHPTLDGAEEALAPRHPHGPRRTPKGANAGRSGGRVGWRRPPRRP